MIVASSAYVTDLPHFLLTCTLFDCSKSPFSTQVLSPLSFLSRFGILWLFFILRRIGARHIVNMNLAKLFEFNQLIIYWFYGSGAFSCFSSKACLPKPLSRGLDLGDIPFLPPHPSKDLPETSWDNLLRLRKQQKIFSFFQQQIRTFRN